MPNGQHLRQKSKIAEKERDREKIGGRELQRRAAEAMQERVKISHPGTSYPCNFGRPEANQDRVADRSERQWGDCCDDDSNDDNGGDAERGLLGTDQSVCAEEVGTASAAADPGAGG